MVRLAGPTVTASPPSGGDEQGTDEAAKPKRSIGDYVVVEGLVVSILTLGFNQWRTVQDLETTNRGLENAQQELDLTRQELTLTQQGQFSERYAHAIQQLGSENRPSRLTGIYELEQVALDSPDHYQLGMEILADYLRIFTPVASGAGTPGPPAPPNAAEAAEIRAILKVLGRRPKDREPVLELDLSGVNLQGLDLRGENLSGDNFRGADFREAHLDGANLTKAALIDADLTGVFFMGADLAGASLSEANLTQAILFGANLTGTHHLTPEQLDVAVIDEHTTLPPELATPCVSIC
jgi:hypothetical protein